MVRQKQSNQISLNKKVDLGQPFLPYMRCKMITTYKLEPNTVTEIIKQDNSKITFFVLEGKCIFETTYNNDTINVERFTHEKYIIEEKVEYRLKNTCNHPCVLVIIRGLKEEDIQQVCENYITWGLNHIKPVTHFNYNNGTKKSLSAAA